MMKEKLYDIMSDYNEILKDIDAFVNVLKFELKGAEELNNTENIQDVIRVHLRLLRGVQRDSEELYNKIDQTILDMKYEVKAEHTRTLNK